MPVFINGQQVFVGPGGGGIGGGISGDFKESVRLASTADLPLSGLAAIDGVTPVANDRILAKNQSTASQNGVYLAASGAWTRSADFDEDAEVTSGATVFVEEGTANDGDGYTLVTPDPIVVGTTALTFVKSFGSSLIPHGATHVETGSDPVPNATISVGGLLSGAGKTKLDGIEALAKDDQSAAEVSYDNTSSGLTAAQVQEAIDEVEARVDVNDAKISAGGLVTTHSDVSSAGSGAIITTAERSKLTGIEAGAAADQTLAEVLSLGNSTGGTNLQLSGTDKLLGSLGGSILEFSDIASAVNFLRLINAATGFGPIIEPVGTDANIDLTIEGKGTGNLLLQPSGGNIGIGTAVTSGLLHLRGAGTAQTLRIESDAASVGLFMQQLSGSPTANYVNINDSAGNPIFDITSAGDVGIAGIPDSIFTVIGASPGVVGGFASGAFQIRNPSTLVNANAVITGHNSFGGNKQLWYLGSSSSSNDDITLINRQNGALSFFTNNTQRINIKAGGNTNILGVLEVETIASLLGDLNLTTQTGGVFQFNDSAFRAGLDAVEYVEIGHGGGNGFINAVGDGGLDFRFEGNTLATFTDFGHLHLLTNVDQKHTLKIVTANNLNDTGIAWENSGGAFTGTIFRTDIGSNKADLIVAVGQNADIDLLTNSVKFHGSAANEGRFEVLDAFQISSGVPGLDKVLTSDAVGLATWQSSAHQSNHVSGGSDAFVAGDVLEAASRGVRISLRNATGSTLNKGDLVAVTGFDITEGRPTVVLADKDLATDRPAIAVVEATVANNTNFEGLVVGLLTGLNTSSFSANDQLVLGDNGAVSRPPPDVDPFTGEIQLIGSVVRSDVSNGSIYFLLSSTLLPMTAAQTFWVKEVATTGSVGGGDVTRVSGLDVTVALGTGFVNTGGTLFRVTWSVVSTLALTLSATNFIFVTSAGVVTASTSLPDSESNIVLATAITDGTTVVFLANHKILLPERAAKSHRYAEDVVGPITVLGLITKKDAIALRLEVEGGTFYTRDFRATVPATDPITFTYWRRDGSGGFTKLISQTTIDPENFDDGSGTLAAIPAGNWKKDLLFIAPTSSGAVEYHIFYAQETFATQSAAEAGNLPSADSDVLDNSIRSGGVVIQKSAAVIASVVDVRPFLGQLSPGTTAVTDHSLLSGLGGEDDHPALLPVSGSRPMTGALDMGANAITNVGNVDGVDVSAHAARHKNGGADEVATVTPAANAIPKAGSGSELDAGWLPDSVREEAFTWNINGLVSIGTAIDGHRIMRRDGTIVGITMSLGSRGNNGNVIVDVNKHVPTKPITTQRNNTAGVTIYTTQANRPTLAGDSGASGDNAVIEAVAPDVTSFLAGDFLSMDVDASVVNDMDLAIEVHVQYS